MDLARINVHDNAVCRDALAAVAGADSMVAEKRRGRSVVTLHRWGFKAPDVQHLCYKCIEAFDLRLYDLSCGLARLGGVTLYPCSPFEYLFACLTRYAHDALMQVVARVEHRDGAHFEWAAVNVPLALEALRLIRLDRVVYVRAVKNAHEIKRMLFRVRVVAIRDMVCNKALNSESPDVLAFRTCDIGSGEIRPGLIVEHDKLGLRVLIGQEAVIVNALEDGLTPILPPSLPYPLRLADPIGGMKRALRENVDLIQHCKPPFASRDGQDD